MSVLVGKKYLNKLGSKANETVGSEMSAFAQRQMAKMGWKKGQGLGKNSQGILERIAIVKKDDNSGIGAQNPNVENFEDQWWNNVYNKAAGKVTGKTVTKVPTDAELFKACGGRRLCSQGGAHSVSRQQSNKRGKLARAETGDFADGAGIAGELAQQFKEKKKSKKKSKKSKKRKRSEDSEDDSSETSARVRTRSMDAGEGVKVKSKKGKKGKGKGKKEKGKKEKGKKEKEKGKKEKGKKEKGKKKKSE